MSLLIDVHFVTNNTKRTCDDAERHAYSPGLTHRVAEATTEVRQLTIASPGACDTIRASANSCEIDPLSSNTLDAVISNGCTQDGIGTTECNQRVFRIPIGEYRIVTLSRCEYVMTSTDDCAAVLSLASTIKLSFAGDNVIEITVAD